MTPPVATEALVEALARYIDGSAFLPAHQDGRYYKVRREDALRRAEAFVAGPLAPLLAALQQVTAERDEARAEYERGLQHRNDLYDTVLSLRTSLAAIKSREDTANAELARLRAEGEAKDRALKLLLVFVDCAGGEGIVLGGGSYGIPDTDAADICVDVASALGIEFAGPEYTALIEQGQRLHTALARAATAREG